jgi:formylglycine-generating enzyme required for sulfatase activity
MMGNAKGAADEQPPTQMSVAGFEIDKTEVTTADFAACVAAGKCTAARTSAGCNYSRADRADHPINCVTFADANAYCAWADKRLPAEYEWEHAARGAKNTIYPWGDTPPDASRICWRRADLDPANGGTCAVKSFPASDTTDTGISDMAGNVWEWTSGNYCSYTNVSCGDKRRVLRGGGWASDKPLSVTATVRQDTEEGNQSPSIGFRCAKSL